MGKEITAFITIISSFFKTSSDLFNEVRRWQDMQCRRRLFYFNHQEGTPLPGLLMLQKAYVLYHYSTDRLD
jgi:hypothetical protein